MSLTSLSQRALEMFRTQLAPLRPYIDDPAISEIMVNRHDDIWIESGGRMRRLEGLQLDERGISAAVRALATANSKDVSRVLDARMPGYRIAAALHPVAIKGDALCIRKHSMSSRPLQSYVESGAFDPCVQDEQQEGAASLERYLSEHGQALARGGQALHDFLVWCVRTRKNFIVAGSTGSGKTTLMNALLAQIPDDERVLTLEDTAELKVAVPNHVGLEASEPDEIDIRRLVKLSLRFRPDRIVVGEVRGAEAFDLIDAMNTGHSGGGCTLHADSALLALYRLENMVRMSPNASNLPLPALRQLVAQTFHLVIYCSRLGGVRRPVEVGVVRGLRGDAYDMHIIYRAH